MGHQTILVTGASGLLGSNVCRLAAAEGRRVKGLVRKAADAAVLRGLGVEPLIGDVTDQSLLEAALEGVDGVIHGAAVLGGTWSKATREDFERINYGGSINVLQAAAARGVRRTVLISSLVILGHGQTITEVSPLVPLNPEGSHYTRTKLGVYYEGMRRACCGEDVVFVVPGAMYGPSPFVDRALDPTLFTGSLWAAIRGEITEYARFPLTWPYIEDAARITLAALDRGAAGRRYLAAGGPQDVLSFAEFCNLGCAAAGVAHRVRDLALADLSGDIGPMRELATRTYPTPQIDPSQTNQALGITLTPVREGVARTVAWLRDQGRI